MFPASSVTDVNMYRESHLLYTTRLGHFSLSMDLPRYSRVRLSQASVKRQFCTTKLTVPVLSTCKAFPVAVSTLGDAWSFSGLTSKIPLLGSMLNFDADVKKTLDVTNVKTACDRQFSNCLN